MDLSVNWSEQEATKTKSRIHSSWAKEGVTSFFCGIFSWLVEMDTLFFRIIPSYDRTRDVLQYKAPGGDDDQNYEWPQETAAREWKEEVMKPHSKVLLPIDRVELFYHLDLSDQRFSGGIHRKSFWLVPEKSLDNYRNSRVHFRAQDIVDGKDVLRPTMLVQADQLAGIIFKSHLHALALAICKLAENDGIYDILSPSLMNWAMLPCHTSRDLEPMYYRP